MNPSRFVSVLLAAVFATGLAGCSPGKDKQPPQPKVALPALGAAPAWQLKDVNGKAVTSDQFKGKVVVVDFWATWCGPCKIEIPGYIALQKKYEKDGLVIVGISLDQAGPDVVKEFAGKNAINYPLVMGDENVQTAFGGLEAIPTTFLIDRTGQIRDRKVGVEATEDYEKKIQSLLAERSAS